MAIGNSDAGLLFRIRSDSSQASQDIKRLQGEVKAMTGAVQSGFAGIGPALLGTTALFTGIVAAAGAAAYGIFEVAKSAAKFADGFEDLKTKTNLSIQTLSVLKNQAEQTDVGFKTLANSLVIFQKNMEKAVQGNATLRQEFKLIGADINGSVDAALKNAIKRLSQYEEGAARTKLATDLFGRAGADVLVVIDQMGGDFEKAAQRVKALGLMLDDEGSKKADAFNDQLKELRQTTEGFSYALGKSLIPELTTFLRQITDGVGEVNRLTESFNGMQKVLALIRETLIATTPLLRLMNAIADARRPELQGPYVDPSKVPYGPYIESRPQKPGKDKLTLPTSPGGGGGEKDLDAIKLHIRQLEAQAKDAERVYQLETDSLKRQHSDRLINEDEYSAKTIEQEKKLLAAKLAIYAEEEREAEAVKLPRKRLDALLKVQEREKQARQEFLLAVRALDDEQIRQEAEADAKLAAMKKAALEEDKRILEEQEQFLRDHYRLLTDIYAGALRAQINLLGTFYSTSRAAAARNYELDAAEIETNFQRQKEDLEKQIQLIKDKVAVDEEENTRLLAQRKALNDRIVALEAEKNARIKLIERQAQIDAETRDPFSVRNQVGAGAADQLAQMGPQVQGLGGLLQGFKAAWKSTWDEISQSGTQSMQAIGGMLEKMTVGFLEAGLAAFTSGQSVGLAMKQMASAVLAGIAKIAAVEAIKNIGYALNAMGWTIFTGDPRGALAASHYWASAAAWGSIAIGTAIAARATSGGGGSAGGPSNEFGSVAPAQGQPRIINQNTQPAIVVIRVKAEPGVIVEHLVNDYKNNGQLRQLIQGDK